MRLHGPILAIACGMFTACASEEHEEHEFETHDECVEHYESEGYTPAEIDELCADHEGSDEG